MAADLENSAASPLSVHQHRGADAGRLRVEPVGAGGDAADHRRYYFGQTPGLDRGARRGGGGDVGAGCGAGGPPGLPGHRPGAAGRAAYFAGDHGAGAGRAHGSGEPRYGRRAEQDRADRPHQDVPGGHHSVFRIQHRRGVSGLAAGVLLQRVLRAGRDGDRGGRLSGVARRPRLLLRERLGLVQSAQRQAGRAGGDGRRAGDHQGAGGGAGPLPALGAQDRRFRRRQVRTCATATAAFSASRGCRTISSRSPWSPSAAIR